MNSLSECIKNYLIVAKSTDYLHQLFKLCLENVKNGRLVLIITSELYDFTNLLNELNISKDQLKNFIIMYYKTIDEISRKLLLLHSWSLLPAIVAVDLSQLLYKESEIWSTSVSLMQKVTLCTVSLLAYLQSIAIQRARSDVNTSEIINGLLILRKDLVNFGDVQIQILKDLYFYKSNLYESIDDVRSSLSHEGDE